MSRIPYCEACSMQAAGAKTRIAIEHTCGLETGAINPEIQYRVSASRCIECERVAAGVKISGRGHICKLKAPIPAMLPKYVVSIKCDNYALSSTEGTPHFGVAHKAFNEHMYICYTNAKEGIYKNVRISLSNGKDEIYVALIDENGITHVI